MKMRELSAIVQRKTVARRM